MIVDGYANYNILQKERSKASGIVLPVFNKFNCTIKVNKIVKSVEVKKDARYEYTSTPVFFSQANCPPVMVAAAGVSRDVFPPSSFSKLMKKQTNHFLVFEVHSPIKCSIQLRKMTKN